ncbi:MAG: hypothetical protein A2052_04105 [Deltaproteobacteria bacterium GWA2_54_12]|nr:MAG: hypothetical protein A2052_04105 [Deltaproteobacteria bacterium GWA2_54_12]
MRTADIQRLAAIDLGTNSFHLIIVEISEKSRKFRTLYKEKRMVRLGGGGMKCLSGSAMERGIEALKRFKTIADLNGAPVRAIATSALREAANRDAFIRRARRAAGIRIEVVSGEEEAALIYQGVLSCLPVFNKKVLLIDIGGGSTEFVIGKRREALFAASLRLGAVRLTRRFFTREKTDAASIMECRSHIAGQLDRVAPSINAEEYDAVVGSSGTIFNIARMIGYKRDGTRYSKKDRLSFSRIELFEMVDEIIAARDARKRAGLKGLDSGRADIITAGALILKESFKKFRIKSMTVSGAALREGIVLDTMDRGSREDVHCPF